MPDIVAIAEADDCADAIHRAVDALMRDELVGLPTETGYVVAASSASNAAVRQLCQLIQEARADDTSIRPAPTLTLRDTAEVLNRFPRMADAGRKLVKRCWPGPVTLGFSVTKSNGALRGLGNEAQTALTQETHIWCAAPSHVVVQGVLQGLSAPMIIGLERHANGRVASTLAELNRTFRSTVTLLIDAGEVRFREPSTVVRIDESGWHIESPGVVTEKSLARLTSDVYLFICSGNTCRSPMAEAFFRKYLAEKLNCREDELIDHGFVTVSAGLSAVDGRPASQEAIHLLNDRGIDLRGHESRALTSQLLEHADFIFTMTRSHRDWVIAQNPENAGCVRLLDVSGADVPDPFGGGMSSYEQCSNLIERNIRTIVERVSRR